MFVCLSFNVLESVGSFDSVRGMEPNLLLKFSLNLMGSGVTGKEGAASEHGACACVCVYVCECAVKFLPLLLRDGG